MPKVYEKVLSLEQVSHFILYYTQNTAWSIFLTFMNIQLQQAYSVNPTILAVKETPSTYHYGQEIVIVLVIILLKEYVGLIIF